MRAFMSDHDSANRQYHEAHDGQLSGVACAINTLAYDEAERILAETEPGAWSPLASICASTNVVTLPELATAYPHEFVHRGLRASLAESLSAFIESEVGK